MIPNYEGTFVAAGCPCCRDVFCFCSQWGSSHEKKGVSCYEKKSAWTLDVLQPGDFILAPESADQMTLNFA